jgi:hypothetical protein
MRLSPKQKKNLVKKRRGLLAKYEEGVTVAQLAEDEYLNVRTIQRMLQQARDDRDREQAHMSILKDAIVEHQRELMSLVKRTIKALPYDEPGPVLGMLEQEFLWKALHSHLPRIRLWRALSNMDAAVEGLKVVSVSVTKKVKEEMEPLLEKWPLIETTTEFGIIEGFSLALIDLATRIASGRLDITKLNIHPEVQGEGFQIRVGKYYIAICRKEEYSPILDAFKTMLSKATEWPEVAEAGGYLREYHRNREIALDDLQTILHRHIVLGNCQYCIH